MMDALYDAISTFVCEHGPCLLTRGMNPWEANVSILECLEALLTQRRKAEAAVSAAKKLVADIRSEDVHSERTEKLIQEFEECLKQMTESNSQPSI